MRKVELRMNEKNKYDVIKDLVDHNGNKKRAALKLGITERQINRLIIKYKENGKSAFVHGNRGQAPAKALDKSVSENIILLYIKLVSYPLKLEEKLKEMLLKLDYLKKRKLI